MGYTYTRPKDHADHMRVMKVATDALTEEYGTRSFSHELVKMIFSRRHGPVNKICPSKYNMSYLIRHVPVNTISQSKSKCSSTWSCKDGMFQ